MRNRGNLLFGLYRSAQGEVRQSLERELIKEMKHFGYAICAKKLRDRRPDIVNQAIQQALRAQSGFRGDSTFFTWYHHIVENLCSSYLRKKQQLAEVQLEEQADEKIAGEPTFEITPKLTLEFLTAKLKPRDQRIIRLKVEGYTDQEIAHRLGVGREQFRNRWQYIKRKIKYQIKGEKNAV